MNVSWDNGSVRVSGMIINSVIKLHLFFLVSH